MRHFFIIKAVDNGDGIPVGYVPEGGYTGEVPPEGYIEALGQSTESLKDTYPDLYRILTHYGIQKVVDPRGAIVVKKDQE